MTRTKRAALATLIRVSGGPFTASTAFKAGLNWTDLHRAVDEQVLVRLARGLYAPADTRSEDPKSRILARFAGAGEPAAVSHEGAAFWYGFDGITAPVVSVSVPHGRLVRARGVHQRRRFEDLDLVEMHGVLVTSPLQTLADLGAVVPADVVERALESAIRKGLVTDAELRVFNEKANEHRWGNGVLHQVLARRPVGAPATGSDAETACLQVYRAGGVPEPQRQVPIELDGVTYYADFGWLPLLYLAEVDGLIAHDGQDRLAYDLGRQNLIFDARYEMRRFTAVDVYTRPRYVCTETLRGLAIARSRL